jgi:hypothetical protein
LPEQRVTYDGDLVSVGSASIRVAHAVIDAALVGETLVVVYDYMLKQGAWANLEAFDLSGARLWTAENPTNHATDAYVNIMNTAPLVVGNFAGYECQIDPRTGAILESRFTK